MTAYGRHGLQQAYTGRTHNTCMSLYGSSVLAISRSQPRCWTPVRINFSVSTLVMHESSYPIST